MKKLALPRFWTWKTWSSCLVPTGNASSPTFKVSIAASGWRTKNLSSSHKDLSATPQSYWIIIKYHSPIWVLSLSHSLPTLFGSFNLIYFIDAFNSHFLLFWLFGRFFLFFEKRRNMQFFHVCSYQLLIHRSTKYNFYRELYILVYEWIYHHKSVNNH